MGTRKINPFIYKITKDKFLKITGRQGKYFFNKERIRQRIKTKQKLSFILFFRFRFIIKI